MGITNHFEASTNEPTNAMRTMWLRNISEATAAHQLREIFKRSFTLIRIPEIHNSFLERIYYLKNRAVSSQDIQSLEDLEDDIEDEIECGELRRLELERMKQEVGVVEAPETVVNELQEMLEDNFIIQDELIGQKDLVARAEKELILKTLQIYDWNRTKASKALGISYRTLRNKLSAYLRERTQGSLH